MASVKEILSKHLENVKKRIQEQIVGSGRSASGKTAASMRVEVEETKGSILANEAMSYMERGRGAGRVPKGFVGIIKAWIKAKGISVTPIPSKRESAISPEERGLNSLAGAIAYTIMKKGTKLHRERGYNDIYTTAIDAELAEMSKELCLNVAEDVLRINQSL